MGAVILKPGREKSLLRRHPWIFSGAVAQVVGNVDSGATVEVRAATGQRLGWGAYSPHSQITVRMWTFAPEARVDSVFLRRRLAAALSARQCWAALGRCTALRVVNAESDGLPGVVVDRYDHYLVCQFLCAGAEYWKSAIVAALTELCPDVRGVYERSDAEVREKEGLPPVTGVLAGERPPERLEIREGDCRFIVDVYSGHKTGFYLDQRENRALVSAYAAGREVLNCFAYTGGFGVRAVQGGAAQVTNVDTSEAALTLGQHNFALNGADVSRVRNLVGDAFQVLRQFRDAQRQFDLIILDPPKFATAHSQLERALAGYKDINLLAFKLLRPGGVLFTFSCSGLVSSDLFQKVVAGAALDAGREAQIVRRMTQAPDHPVALNFPEGEYLKGLVCQVLG